MRQVPEAYGGATLILSCPIVRQVPGVHVVGATFDFKLSYFAAGARSRRRGNFDFKLSYFDFKLSYFDFLLSFDF